MMVTKNGEVILSVLYNPMKLHVQLGLHLLILMPAVHVLCLQSVLSSTIRVKNSPLRICLQYRTKLEEP